MEQSSDGMKREDNVRLGEFDFMLDLEKLNKETTAADPNLTELQCCLENDNIIQVPEDYKPVIKRLTRRWGTTVVDDCIIIPKHLR